MPATADLIADEFDTAIKDAIASGRYRSEREIVTAALRMWREREEKLNLLRDEIDAGLADLERGDRYPADEVFREIRENAARKKEARS
jgi:putative addiction module CopG family antidote